MGSDCTLIVEWFVFSLVKQEHSFMITVSWELEVVTAITLSFIKQMGY